MDGLGTGRPRFDSSRVVGTLLFIRSRTALGPTQQPYHGLPVTIRGPWVVAPWRWPLYSM